MKLIKKLFIAAFGLMMLQTTATADDNIHFSQLPPKAQTIVKNHFGNQKIDEIEMEKEDGRVRYEVKFINGNTIEFGKLGNWKEIECKKHGVPMRLVPAPILKHIAHRWPNKHVRVEKIERKENKYEVELSNDVEITFNKNFKIIDVDKD